MFKVKQEHLQLYIPADQNYIVKDAGTNEIDMSVMRNFCEHAGVLKWINKVVTELEDPGKLAQIVFSAGSMRKPKFDWVKNLLSKSLLMDIIKDIDLNQFLEKNQMCRMDARDPSDAFGRYAIKARDDSFYEFIHVELAPPGGVFV
ncbi:hypothetical protein SERLADRAFT_434248 [Serpula lacrymans var. lacrymans S7.9]|uniref:Uncharacterized protein n=1 Tax=Serpula lacrymans var. lacrymans (strain S7.9) TaxID=578457 RepID=F8NK77_SERL9|nr:uncharacterized protein SERLADRAFT_434248 [Serpula lacrymans var. lacrymans S7.9]EGO28343.1 hypothetical protein SERLADRAFT_434248 [Serpula lacrymans var. lacrymans S7.9]